MNVYIPDIHQESAKKFCRDLANLSIYLRPANQSPSLLRSLLRSLLFAPRQKPMKKCRFYGCRESSVLSEIEWKIEILFSGGSGTKSNIPIL